MSIALPASKRRISSSVSIIAITLVALLISPSDGVAQEKPATNPLPSWADTPSRRAIVAFVDKVTEQNSADFIPPPERIAVFDNDGTLWSEQPIYVQAQFVFDRIHVLAPQHPEWKTQEPFASVLTGNKAGIAAAGEKGLLELMSATHSGMTIEEFNQIVSDWIATAKHPRTGKKYTQMVFQPMLELLSFLRDRGFKTYIVSGGGVEFMRPWTEKVYGIPPEQVVGSYGVLQLETVEGKPVLRKLPKIGLIDDGPGKPVGIQTFIGRRPIMAFGNSDGDLEMLTWTTAGPGPRFGLIVHHTDAQRETAYDRDSHIGKLDKALDAGKKLGWTIVDMKNDWKRIFPD